MLTPEQLKNIRSWGKEIYTFLIEQDLDTTPERIKINRDRLRPLFERSEYISAIRDSLSGVARVKANAVLDLLYDYYHYFDLGYRSKTHIDDFPEKLKEAFAKVSVLEE